MEKPGFTDMSDMDKEPSNPHIPWKQLVTSFKEGGLTPAQYASFGMSTSCHHVVPSPKKEGRIRADNQP
jgi:hypothetical protein